ncbi:MAG: hypothetical protein JXL67_14240 [Calditrichaeota bacterium]|nr:hypothetical protein [Calditrichota bacterium]
MFFPLALLLILLVSPIVLLLLSRFRPKWLEFLKAKFIIEFTILNTNILIAQTRIKKLFSS